jgi:hypothetical protein
VTSFNELQREIVKRKVDPNVGFLISLVYERLLETDKQLTEAVKLIDAMANSLAGFVELRERDQEALKRLMRDSHMDGVSVQSVANDPEEE